MNQYVTQLLTSNRLPDVIPAFANYVQVKDRDKEISESMACLAALQGFFNQKEIEGSKVLVVGDGKFPRTGMVISHFTPATVESIDPLLDINWWERYKEYKKNGEGRNVNRIQLHSKKFEDFDLSTTKEKNVFLILPHSHAPFYDTVKKLNNAGIEPSIISMPCCVNIPEQIIEASNPAIFVDKNILSPKNKIYIWKKLNVIKK